MEDFEDIEISRKSERKRAPKKSGSAKVPPVIPSKPHTSVEVIPQVKYTSTKLRTSKDIYNRLKWDADSLNIDLSQVFIGYHDRFLGMCEIPFRNFHPLSSSHDDQPYDDHKDDLSGEIPYHRVHYFRGGGPALYPTIGSGGEVAVRQENWPPSAIFYWDRDSRTDLIFNSGHSGGGKGASTWKSENSKSFSNLPVYKFNPVSQSWEPVPQTHNYESVESQPLKRTLKVLTLNILFDLYDPQIVQTSLRWPQLLKFLSQSDADIIALQEVTSSFLTLLESEAWVKSTYFLTESSSQATTIQPYGQILLSKLAPSRLLFTLLPGEKRAIIGTFPTGGRLFHVANLHLSSNAKKDSSALRRSQMDSALQLVAGLEEAALDLAQSDVIVLGDTNFSGDEGPGHRLELDVDLVDAWTALEGDSSDPGYTFDVEKNPLASQLSVRKVSERYDRVYFKASNSLAPTRIRVVGREQFRANSHNLCISDHYGLEVDFEMRHVSNPGKALELETSIKLPNQASKIVYTSAVAIIPPREIWDKIQEIRSKHDPSAPRWPPHFTLFHKFWQEEENHFEDAAFHQTTSDLRAIPPFTVEFTQIKTFQHSNSVTIYLAPEEEGARRISEIYQHLVQNYHEITADNHPDHRFTPHLTLGKLPTTTQTEVEKVQKLISQWEHLLLSKDQNTEQLSFTVDRIHFISRIGNTPFRIRNTISLGQECQVIEEAPVLQDFLQQHILSSPVVDKIDQLRDRVAQELERVCNLAVCDNVQLQLTGSAFLGVHDEGSDLDFSCFGPRNVTYQSFFFALETVMHKQGAELSLKLDSIILETKIPIARFEMEGLAIDLVYSNIQNPLDLSPEEIIRLDLVTIRSLNAFREGSKLLEIVPPTHHDIYRVAVRSLKYWAKQRNVYNPSFGLLGSSSISILVAYLFHNKTDNRIRSAPELVAAFFETFSNWSWPKPVQFHESTALGLDKCKSILNPSKIPELMPILSPSYPFLNRNLTVTNSTMSLLEKEFKRADSILSQVLIDFKHGWETVVERSKFFCKYSNYCCVRVEIGKGSVDKETLSSNIKIVQGILKRKLINLMIDLERKCGYRGDPYSNILTSNDLSLDLGGLNVENKGVVLCFLGLEMDSRSLVLEHGSEVLFRSVLSEFTSKIETKIQQFCDGHAEVKITKIKKDSPVLQLFLHL